MENKEVVMRIKALIESKNESPSGFSKLIGFNQSNFSKILRGERDVPTNLVNAICEKLDVPYRWLIAGEGPMLVAGDITMSGSSMISTGGSNNGNTTNNYYQGCSEEVEKMGLEVAALGDRMAEQENGESQAIRPHVSAENYLLVPVLNLDARGGMEANDVLEGGYVTERLPFARSMARNGDFVIQVYGDSMSPKYPSGSLVLLRPIEAWHEYIEFGAVHVVELQDDRRLLKIVRKGSEEGQVTLASINPAYDPAEVSVRFIRRMFRVQLCIQRDEL